MRRVRWRTPPSRDTALTAARILALGTALGATLSVAADGLYLGVSASAAFYDVDYSKAADSRHADNVSANAGRIFSASDSADDTT